MSSADSKLCLGLMSGTSMDGIDVALVEVHGPGKLQVLATHEEPYPPELRERLVGLVRTSDRLLSGTDFLAELCQLNVEVAEAFAGAALALIRTANAGRPVLADGWVYVDELPRRIDVIGSHGQTLFHIPRADASVGWRTASTLQIGDANVIAARVGVPTVGQLRMADMAEGGVGAPIMPFAELFCFFSSSSSAHTGAALFFQNIGGIANATLIDRKHVLAFDSGPATGRVIEPLLAHALEHPYFAAPLPKATGLETFGAGFLDGPYWGASGHVPVQASLADLLATAVELTAITIANGYRQLLAEREGPAPTRTVVSGGGSKNDYLMGRLGFRCRELGLDVVTSDLLGIQPDSKEAVGMAIIGFCALVGLPCNLPSVTGARNEVVLGQLANPFSKPGSRIP